MCGEARTVGASVRGCIGALVIVSVRGRVGTSVCRCIGVSVRGRIGSRCVGALACRCAGIGTSVRGRWRVGALVRWRALARWCVARWRVGALARLCISASACRRTDVWAGWGRGGRAKLLIHRVVTGLSFLSETNDLRLITVMTHSMNQTSAKACVARNSVFRLKITPWSCKLGCYLPIASFRGILLHLCWHTHMFKFRILLNLSKLFSVSDTPTGGNIQGPV